jgi:hypothetical protein
MMTMKLLAVLMAAIFALSIVPSSLYAAGANQGPGNAGDVKKLDDEEKKLKELKEEMEEVEIEPDEEEFEDLGLIMMPKM